jgi:hypothetical protein
LSAEAEAAEAVTHQVTQAEAEAEAKLFVDLLIFQQQQLDRTFQLQLVQVDQELVEAQIQMAVTAEPQHLEHI